jgi:hypothetical protein
MRRARVRALFVALVISVALPAPIASGAPPEGRGPAEATNPDLQQGELSHRGRAVPATKDRTANPGRLRVPGFGADGDPRRGPGCAGA